MELRLDCPKCEEIKEKGIEELKEHLALVHLGCILYSCPSCNTDFFSPLLAKEHITKQCGLAEDTEFSSNLFQIPLSSLHELQELEKQAVSTFLTKFVTKKTFYGLSEGVSSIPMPSDSAITPSSISPDENKLIEGRNAGRKRRRMEASSPEYIKQSTLDHECEHIGCCDVASGTKCSFCLGLHLSENCAVVTTQEERHKILKGKDLCFVCEGVHQRSTRSCSRPFCSYCKKNTFHCSALCKSPKMDSHLKELRQFYEANRLPDTPRIIELREMRVAVQYGRNYGRQLAAMKTAGQMLAATSVVPQLDPLAALNLQNQLLLNPLLNPLLDPLLFFPQQLYTSPLMAHLQQTPPTGQQQQHQQQQYYYHKET